MPMRFKPSGKQQVRHYYRRPPLASEDEWDNSPFASCCLEDDPLQESLQPDSDHLR